VELACTRTLATTIVKDAPTETNAPNAYEVAEGPAAGKLFALEMALSASATETAAAAPPTQAEMRPPKSEPKVDDLHSNPVTPITPIPRATSTRPIAPGRTAVLDAVNVSNVAHGIRTEEATSTLAPMSTTRSDVSRRRSFQ